MNKLKLHIESDNFTDESHRTPVRALPSTWYTSPEMFELERRAIFSKKWLLVTHQNRLAKAGDWLKFNATGYEFVVTRDRKGGLNAFHNVCRHRAFPVVQGGTQGNSSIFACKYHGWSYGLSGNLAKAPNYDVLEGFDKSKNGLFKIHLKLDGYGFIWVNLDSSDNPEPWAKYFDAIDQQDRLANVNFEDYQLDHEYSMEGNYNWKILADNFNECYHCPTTHPDLPTLADLGKMKCDTDKQWIKHSSVQTEEQKKAGFQLASTYFYPNASVVVLPHFMMIQRFVPTSATHSSMSYQIFRNTKSSDADFRAAAELYARVVSEDKDLCIGAQKNLEAGVFISGELHPRLEHGPLSFQDGHRDAIHEHVKLEKAAGRQIWPARQRLPEGEAAKKNQEDEELCSSLSCGGLQEVLAW
ncbi:Rieske [2Fe-2S] iron-sulfur domain-containing protein [Fusarium flagelliforme]|uniref:Choline monooxygenase, chloroplastic n=1 Tax=Fusarium flagelliforme TaxID=2675880 RepID=A0A395N252_9HYPO|nr:Rieske [2Fe-2S] iron-sulfur domain-containing protein [Fusarium flagelliforme]KAH7185031.1 Rieske [2Fe-2S] iron-sulfur domain-containing protein [Fusarium flagelliforme]RFN54065.1 cytochrome p450 oxidoreductase [Fusarium flagelliforme]